VHVSDDVFEELGTGRRTSRVVRGAAADCNRVQQQLRREQTQRRRAFAVPETELINSNKRV